MDHLSFNVRTPSLKNGIPWSFNTQFPGRVGKMSINDPGRQIKNEFIVLTVLSRRAAVEGGVSPEGAYYIADYYIQLSESCNDINTLYLLFVEMHQAFLARVQLVKQNSGDPRVISNTKDYIETHIHEKIEPEKMARDLGYTPYYLSRLFKKHTGESINTYLCSRQIEKSKEMLKNSSLSLLDISLSFHFSSPSYYCRLFKRFTGMTPTEYRNSFMTV